MPSTKNVSIILYWLKKCELNHGIISISKKPREKYIFELCRRNMCDSIEEFVALTKPLNLVVTWKEK